ncbi:hypothetical protein SRHO_G00140580 [Serrasalmus rhombeus]
MSVAGLKKQFHKATQPSNLNRSPVRGLHSGCLSSAPALTAASSASGAASPPREKPASPGLAKELAALKSDIIQAVTSELTRALTAEFHSISRDYHSKLQTELQEMKSELLQDNASLRAELGSVVRTVSEVETSLSALSDEVVGLRARVESLSSELVRVDAKCEDLEARSRRQNIRIIGVPEGDSRFTLSNSNVSELLREALSLEKSPLVDRAHRSLAPRPKPDGPPRPIIVRLHYFEDCARILREARNRPRITFSDMNLSIYPDLTSKVAKARAAFNTIRRKLRSMDGVKYGMFYPARLRITYKGESREFTSPTEAERFISTMPG